MYIYDMNKDGLRVTFATVITIFIFNLITKDSYLFMIYLYSILSFYSSYNTVISQLVIQFSKKNSQMTRHLICTQLTHVSISKWSNLKYTFGPFLYKYTGWMKQNFSQIIWSSIMKFFATIAVGLLALATCSDARKGKGKGRGTNMYKES